MASPLSDPRPDPRPDPSAAGPRPAAEAAATQILAMLDTSPQLWPELFLAACKGGDPVLLAALECDKGRPAFPTDLNRLQEILRKSPLAPSELYRLLATKAVAVQNKQPFVDMCWHAAMERTPPDKLEQELQRLPRASAICIASVLETRVTAESFAVFDRLGLLPNRPTCLLARATRKATLAACVGARWKIAETELLSLASKLPVLRIKHLATLRALGITAAGLKAAVLSCLRKGTLEYEAFLAANKQLGPFTHAELADGVKGSINRLPLCFAILKRLHGDTASVREMAAIYHRVGANEKYADIISASKDLSALAELLSAHTELTMMNLVLHDVLHQAVRAGDLATVQLFFKKPRLVVWPGFVEALAALRAVDEPTAVDIVRCLVANAVRLSSTQETAGDFKKYQTQLPEAEAMFLAAGSLAATRAINASGTFCGRPERFCNRALQVAALNCPAFVAALTADFFATPSQTFSALEYCVDQDRFELLAAIFAVLEPPAFARALTGPGGDTGYLDQCKTMFARELELRTVVALLGTPELRAALGARDLLPVLDAEELAELIGDIFSGLIAGESPAVAAALAEMAATNKLLPALRANKCRLLKTAYAAQCKCVLDAARAAGLGLADYVKAMPEIGFIAAELGDCAMQAELVRAKVLNACL